MDRPHASSTPLGRVHVDDVSFTIEPARSWPSPVSRATARPSSPRRCSGSQDHVQRVDPARRARAGRPRRVRQILDAGVGFIPEDRQADGLVGDFTIAENLMLNRSFGAPFVRRGSAAAASSSTSSRSEKLQEYDVRAPGITHAGRASSRAATSRRSWWPASSPATCACSWPPSRRAASTSARSSSSTSRSSPPATPAIPVLVVSTELDEVVALADRIMVLYRGRIVGIVPADTPREVLGLMMTGERPEGVVRMSTRPVAPERSTRPGAGGGPAPPRARAAGTRCCATIASGNALVAVLAVFLAVLVGSLMIAAHRRGRSARPRATSSPGPGDFFQASWNADLGRLHRAVPRLDLQHPCRGLRDRHPAADRDPEVRRPADRGRSRRRPGVPGRAVQHRWSRPDAPRRRRRRVGRLSSSTCRWSLHLIARDPRRHGRPGRCGPAWPGCSRPAPAPTR